MARRRAVVDSSDESGNENEAGPQTSQNGVINLEADSDSESSESSSDSGSDSSSGDGLVDDKAVEDEYDKGHKSGPVFIPYQESFPQFSRLPPELRSHIWELFCPDLASRDGRLLRTEAIIVEPSDRTIPTHWELRPHGVFLEQQTADLRTVAAVNHESRELVTTVFPDELALHDGSGDAVVRFNGSRDVIGIKDEFETTPVIRQGSSLRRSVGTICKNAQHVAFSLVYHTVAENDEAIIDADFCNGINDMLDKFPRAKIAYVWVESTEVPFIDRWAGTPYAHKYELSIEEALEFKFSTLTWIYAWPNVVEHPDFCKVSIIEPFRRELDDESLDDFDKKGIKLLPLVSYGWDEEELARLEAFAEEYKAGVPIDVPWGRGFDDSDDDGESSEETPDEYESDGIDDREIMEREEDSDDELMPGAVDAVDSSDTEAGDDNDTAGRTIPRGRKRRVVSDSDEDSDVAGPSTKRARRQAPQPALASDEDLPSSSGSDDDEQPSNGASARNRSIQEMFKNNGALSSESSESSSEDSDDEQEAAPRLSLAERLQQFREEVPVPDDDDEAGSEVGFDYRTRMPPRDGSDAESEEPGSVGVWSSEDEEDEGSEDEDGDGMIDGMAEDTEEGSEGGDSDE